MSKKLSQETIDEIRRLRASGCTYIEIAEKVRVNESTVRRYMYSKQVTYDPSLSIEDNMKMNGFKSVLSYKRQVSIIYGASLISIERDNRKAKVIELFNKGMCATEISKLLKFPESTICDYLNRCGIDASRNKVIRNRITAKIDMCEFFRLNEDGVSNKEMAKKLGCCWQTIIRLRHRYGCIRCEQIPIRKMIPLSDEDILDFDTEFILKLIGLENTRRNRERIRILRRRIRQKYKNQEKNK